MASTPPVLKNAEEAIVIRRLLELPRSSLLTPATSPCILLVTRAFHMRRAYRLCDRQGLKVLPVLVDFQA